MVTWRVTINCQQGIFPTQMNFLIFALQAVHGRGGVVTWGTAESVAKALIKLHSEMNLDHIDLSH